MNFKSIGLGVAAATAVVTGMTANPAEALSIAGKQLSFAGSVRIQDLGNGLDTTPGGQIRVNITPINVGTGTAIVLPDSSDSVFGPGPLTLIDLVLDQTGANTWTLPASVANFITGLSPAAGSFTLNQFTLARSSDFSADILGLFTGPNLEGVGQFTTQLAASSRNVSFSADITAVPTPALVPAALGFGAAMLRKRKGEQSEQSEKEAVGVKA